MKVINTYVIYFLGAYQILTECEDDTWYMTTTGGFNQRDMTIIKVNPDDAKRILKEMEV
jgi:hypothetical protein